jgi:hypothetical protein
MKRKLNGKLTLNKETLITLTKDDMIIFRGGACASNPPSRAGTSGVIPTEATCRLWKTQCYCK